MSGSSGLRRRCRGAGSAFVIAFIAAAAAACSSSSSPPSPRPSATAAAATPHATSGDSGGARRVDLRAAHTAHLGTPGRAEASSIRAQTPRVSATRLSRHGVAPARGYYVSFAVKIRNLGTKPLTVAPVDFWVMPGRISTIAGTATASGASSQFVTTTLARGQAIASDLTFDVPSRHGALVYSPDRHTHVTWRF